MIKLICKKTLTIGSCPSRTPNLIPRTAWGERLMFSAPPVNTISLSPKLISYNTTGFKQSTSMKIYILKAWASLQGEA